MSVDLRVLLIEDNDNDALLLLRELESGGFNPISERVQTASALKACLDESDWDIAISDYVMPEFCGSEAVAIIAEHPKDIPCIMVSGKMGEEYAVEAMRLGAEDYILKDKLSRLVPAVQRELRDAAARRQQAEAEKKLEQTREQYRLVVEGTSESILVANNGLFLFVNRAFAELTGRPADEWVGTPFPDCLHPDERERALQYHIDRLFGNPAPERYVARIMDADGKARWMQVTTTVIDWQGEKASLSFAADISDRMELEEELRQTNEELRTEQQDLQRKNIALSEVLTQLEHEKREIERRLVENIDTAVRPPLQRLKEGIQPHQVQDLRSLEEALGDVVSPFIGHLKGKAAGLSARELEVCRMIKSGASSKDVAQNLNLALTTVKKYRELIRRKLGLSHKKVNLATYLQTLKT